MRVEKKNRSLTRQECRARNDEFYGAARDMLSRYPGTLLEDVIGDKSLPHLAAARHDLMLALHRLNWGNPAIAERLGRDQSTVYYGLQRARTRERACWWSLSRREASQ